MMVKVLTVELVHSTPMAPGLKVVTKLAKLVGLSEGLEADESFARQVRRKFCE